MVLETALQSAFRRNAVRAGRLADGPAAVTACALTRARVPAQDTRIRRRREAAYGTQTFMFRIPSAKPLTTWATAKEAGSPRSTDESKTEPSASIPV